MLLAALGLLGCACASMLDEVDRASPPSLAFYMALAAQAPSDCPDVALPSIPRGASVREFVLAAPAPATGATNFIAFSHDTIVERLLILSQDAHGCVRLRESGRLSSMSARDVWSPLANSALPQDLGPTPVLAVVIDTKTALPWLSVMDRPAFERLSSGLWTLGGIYIGVLLILLLLGFGLAFWQRTSLAYAYALYVASILFYQLEMTGFGPAWVPFWPSPEYFRLLHVLALVATLLGITTMLIAFLEPGRRARITLLVGVGAALLGFSGSLVLPSLYRIAVFAVAVIAVVAMVVLIERLRTRQSAARWFAGGVAALLVAALLQPVAVFSGDVRIGDIATLAMPLGTLMESSLWLVALLIRFRDDRALLQRQLVRAANVDALTGIQNRFRLQREIEQVLDVLRHSHDTCGLLFIDLDGFKRINDRFGHAVGDDVLRSVAAELDTLAINKRALGRWGGDEFALLMACPSRRAEVLGAAQTVVEHLKEPVWSHSEGVAVRASVAAVLLSSDYCDVDAVISDADIALYVAKRNGGAVVAEFTPELRAGSAARSDLREALPGALERGELEVYYQPIFGLCDSQPVGLEALLRWNLPGRETLSAAEFVQMADEMELGADIGAWVIDRTFKQILGWQRAGLWQSGAFVSLNISRHQLAHRRLSGQLERAFATYSIDPLSIRLEVSEALLDMYLDSASAALRELRGLGVMIGVDDFGSGASSLRLLGELEPAFIKIDVGVIEGALHVFRTQEVVQGIIALASVMGCSVIAEGVENEAQLTLLRELGCDQAQGFHFARPVNASQAEPWVALCRAPTMTLRATPDHKIH